MWNAAALRRTVAGGTPLARAEARRFSNRQHDLAGFWRAATEVISAQVPYFWTPCRYTLDLGLVADHEPLPRRSRRLSEWSG